MSEYILKVGDEGADRLDLLNEVFIPYSQYYLTDIGLKKGMRVLEIGCGTGIMTVWIAQQVGPSGQVVAIDASKEQLEHAKTLAKQKGVTNIEFKQNKAEELQDRNLFDMVYSRFLLMHLPNPSLLLKQAYSLLKPGGILACDEPTTDSLLTYPQNPIFEKLNQVFLLLGKKRNLDFNIGDKLPILLLDLNCQLIKPRFIQPIISIKMAKNFIELGMKEIGAVIEKENILPQDEGQQLVEDFQKLPEDNFAYYAFPRQAQIAGIKQKSI